MISVKIHCGCGQRYAFEVEPVNGLMPSSVVCPVCGADGTGAANEIIAHVLAAQPTVSCVSPTPVAPSITPRSPLQRFSQEPTSNQSHKMDANSMDQRPRQWRFVFWIVTLVLLSLFLYQQASGGRRWVSLPGVLLSMGMLCRLSSRCVRSGLLRRSLSIAQWLFLAGFAVSTIRLTFAG